MHQVVEQATPAATLTRGSRRGNPFGVILVILRRQSAAFQCSFLGATLNQPRRVSMALPAPLCGVTGGKRDEDSALQDVARWRL